MPLPILHSFAGYSVYKLSKKTDSQRKWCRLALFIFLANLADFDFLPGVLQHEALKFHRNISHSLGAAFLCGALFFLGVLLLKRKSAVRTFLFTSGAYLTHIILDFFSGHAPIPIFWPLTSARFTSPIAIFPAENPSLHHVKSFTDFVSWFTQIHTLNILCFEMAVVFTILTFAMLLEGLKKEMPLLRRDLVFRLIQAAVFFTGFVITRQIA